MGIEKELRQVLAELSIVSQMPAADLSRSSKSAEDPGGKRPLGGIDWKDDHDPECVMKSADHFFRRFRRAHSEGSLVLILEDARASLAAWRRQPAPKKDQEPKPDEPGFKRYIAESPESSAVLANRFGLTKTRINEIRAAYEEPPPKVRKTYVVQERRCSNCGVLLPPGSEMCGPCFEFQADREQNIDAFDAEALTSS